MDVVMNYKQLNGFWDGWMRNLRGGGEWSFPQLFEIKKLAEADVKINFII